MQEVWVIDDGDDGLMARRGVVKSVKKSIMNIALDGFDWPYWYNFGS
jgi:hypothetical protein